MLSFDVRFWVNAGGEKPVAEWLKKLPIEDKLYLGSLLRDLATAGPFIRPKVFKHLIGSLWEIRDLRKGPGYRIYFGFDGVTVCLVAASGNKSSQERDLETAKERLGI